ncbi:MAG: AAA family ATPase [Proteobacteria bacterium]|nr:AAA family ATPase [Pseudomonadota bacterium]MCP4921448.1 AAA family ATPase [Pseudomonadota bacterium]
MKICALRVCNLASLKGAHRLDMESGALGRVALFAITGPTGAGKSTLLDALCLALYDRIPRLQAAGAGRVVRPGDDEQLTAKDVRSILRHDSGSGYAEVEFVGNDGLRYRAKWSVHRAGKKPSGRLQSQTMELENLSTGELLGTKGRPKTQTLADIEARVGLSYDQFRRSVLLAQGDFAAFLKSAPGERAALLEKMTGTGIYAELSTEAFVRAKAAADAVDHLGRDLKHLGTLDAGQRTQLRAELAEATTIRQAASRHLETVRAARVWQEADRRLEGAVVEGAAALELATGASKPDWLPELKRAQLLEPLRPARDRVQATRAELTTTQAAHLAATTAVTAATGALTHATTDHARASSDRAALQARQLDLQPRIDAARALDGQLAESQRAEAERRVEGGRAAVTAKRELESTTALRKRLTASRAAVQVTEQSLQALTPWAALDGQDEDLELAATATGPDLAEVQARLDGVLARLETAKAGELDADGKRLDAWCLDRDIAVLDGRIDKGSALVETTKARLDQQEKVYAQTQAAAALDAHRDQLVEGEPCPLCGALEHPRAGSAMGGLLSTLKSDLTQLRKSDQTYRDGLSRLQADRDRFTEQRTGLSDPGPAPDDLEAARTAFGERRAVVESARAERALIEPLRQQAMAGQLSQEARRRVVSRLPDDLAAALKADPASFLKEVPVKLAELRRLQGLRSTQTTAQADLDREHEAQRGRAQQAETTARTEAAQAVEAAENVKRIQTERAAALEGTVAQVEASLRQDRERIEAALAAATLALTAARVAVADAAAQATAGKTSLDTAAERADVAQTQLAELLTHHEMTERDLEGLTLSAEDVRRRADELRALGEAVVQARAVVAERTAQRDAHRATPCPLETDPELEKAAVAALEGATETHATLKAQLDRDAKAVEQGAELQAQLTVAQRTASAWERLSKVIGSKQGSKFRDFAQGLTLDRLLAHANGQLRDLAPRYALRRVPGHNLDIQVEDQALAGDVRSAASLSGGETFLVSLALALGLASMSADTAQVESLFIDEGFGHLDQRSLELALATLDALQHKGRKVGVISHVQGLGEHIPIRVEVRPLAPGRSTLVLPR